MSLLFGSMMMNAHVFYMFIIKNKRVGDNKVVQTLEKISLEIF